ncbi:MAG: OmpA family protein [Lentimicrobiaceae bacterium]|jgi:outer membrane protein OmpA-like peptidoglycan-associated protein|nr:OmpA family protein [Lentimicrobiaceae bacterium]
MKKSLLFIAILLFAMVSVTKAQNKENPWGLGFGFNWADYNAPDLKFADQLKYANWQGNNIPGYFSLSRYLCKSFNVEAAFNWNGLDKNKMKLIGQPLTTETFWKLDANLQYKFANGYILNEKSWFDPYITLGIGGTNMNEIFYYQHHAGIGFNIWLAKYVGVFFQGTYDMMFDRKDYFHYAGGIKFRFGGKSDLDGDGIADIKDLCPTVAGVEALQGCPDRDGDGIADKDDKCPDVKGLATLQGCPDRDGDGIADNDDQCPDEKGLATLKGCPDRDGDGVADKDDKCPDVKGVATLQGCPDRDGDGITDKDDQCPDVKGLAKFNGCPDTDGDGIADKDDQCPDVAGTVANKGCPEITKKEKEAILSIAKSVYFDTGKNILKKESKMKLNELVTILKNNPNLKITVEGHTDNVGKDEMNMKLSQKRTNIVVKYLVDKGIDKSRLTSQGYGETKPVADNKTRDGRAKNRRVELVTNY